MFTKEERKAFNEAYWKEFRSYIRNTPNSNGSKINWLNYPTETKLLYIRLSVDSKKAEFSVDIQSKDDGIRSIIWEQLLELKVVLESEMPSEGTWIEERLNQARQPISSIIWELSNVSQFKSDDKKHIFTFFEKHLIRFDAFYQEYKDIILNLIK